ncbi:MAG: glycoside hydrolase family 3 C-terminal domain-containing protein [Lachnospiraceae bacterium]|nr:glycoside hydrolase family 3 C-terminal domain-containing protein [Lachnospiraceae bacterium]
MTKNELLSLAQKLTLDEKISMIHGAALFKTAAVKEKEIPAFCFSDGPMGTRPEFEWDEWLLIGGNDDYSSYLPCNSAIAATFNRECAYTSGQVLGLEARGKGKDMILAPGINIHRSPLCGRNFEYMSEDPYLTTQMAVPYVKGIQESDVSACVKHFAVNNQETQRHGGNSTPSERALWEIYFPAFRATVQEGNTLGMMASYNRYMGEYACHSRELLDTILRSEWNFDGIVVSDWGGVHDTEKAANCSLDIEMGCTPDFDDYYMASPLKKAIEEGRVSEAEIDKKIMHILHTMNELHMLDGKRKRGGYNLPSSREKLRLAAEESIVLLKNDKKTLPLNPDKIKKLLVIGDNADRVHSHGGGSAEIKSLYEISPLLGLKMYLGGNCEVIYEPGYYNFVVGNAWGKENSQNVLGNLMMDESKNPYLPRQKRYISEENLARVNAEYLEKAKQACKDADAVLFIGGLTHDQDVEDQDRKDYHLPCNQDYVIRELLKVRPDMIVTLIGGSPVSMSEWKDMADTIIYSYYNGMEGGLAFAHTVFGEVSPSGKLPTSFPKQLSDCGAHGTDTFPGIDTVEYKEGIFVGYRHLDSRNIEPEFAFGHGLSYAEFNYHNMEVRDVTEDMNMPDNCKIERDHLVPIFEVSCQVSNTSQTDAKESVQLYIAPCDTTLPDGLKRPVKELRGFDKKMIKAGEDISYHFSLTPEAFSYYDETEHCYIAPKGNYNIMLASSSRDIRLVQKITLHKDYKISRS